MSFIAHFLEDQKFMIAGRRGYWKIYQKNTTGEYKPRRLAFTRLQEARRYVRDIASRGDVPPPEAK